MLRNDGLDASLSSTTTNVAATTLQSLQQLDENVLSDLRHKLASLDDSDFDRVIVELRVKQVRDEETPKGS